MIGFAPIVSPTLLWLLVAGVLIALAVAVRPARRIGRPAAAWSILGLRAALAGVLVLCLLNPYRVWRRPDPRRFELGFLADVSGSMSTRDCGRERSRIRVVREAGLGRLLPRLRRRYRVRAWTFASRPAPYVPGAPVRILPGATAIGDSLVKMLDAFQENRLGGVVLLSDGHNQRGRSPTDAAKLLRRRHIPLTCIGIGSIRRQRDMGVRFLRHELRARKGELLELPVEVTNRSGCDAVIRVRLAPGWGGRIEHQLRVAAGENRRDSFRVRPARAGFQTVAVRIRPPRGADSRPENDVDYVALRVAEPDRFRVLWLGSHFSWEYKFLKLALTGDKQISLAAVIRTGKKRWYRAGFQTDEPEARTPAARGFPVSLATLERFDAVLMDTGVFPFLDAKQRRVLRDFVDKRGGGLLCFGALNALPPDIRGMLPVKETRRVIPRRRVRLAVLRDLAFQSVVPDLFEAPPGPFLPAAVPVDILRTWKRGARPVILLDGDRKNAVMAVQAYGGGRVACTGMETTWRWRLLSPAGETLHAAYWRNLIAWLAGTARKRIESPVDGSRAPIGAEFALTLDLLGRDFRPAGDARVTAVVRAPSGRERTLNLPLSDQAPGRYSTWFLPEESGEYTVHFRAQLPDELLETEAHFLAARMDKEVVESDYRPGVLRDMARITGGRFLDWEHMDQLDAPAIHAGTAFLETKRHLADSPWPLLLLLALAPAEWYLRRRNGLR